MRSQFNLFILLLTSSAAHASMDLNLTPGVTPLSHDIYSLHMLIFWICVVIGVVVFGVMLYAIIFHRKSLGYKALSFHENFTLEIAWTIIPLLVLIVMAIPATHVLGKMSNTEKEDLTIKVTGYQWKWQYEYLNKNIKFFSNSSTPLDEIRGLKPKNPLYLRTVNNPLVVPIHKKIRFLMTSNDVIHSWWVPALGVKRDALPGFINEAWARINRPGVYYGQCTELCGIDHVYMPIVVIAMGEKDFNNWMAIKTGALPALPAGAPALPLQAPGMVPAVTKPRTGPPSPVTMDALMQKGEQVYATSCSACHQLGGEGMPPTFPALKNSPMMRGPIAAHIDRVLNGKPGTAMQAFRDQLTDEEIAAVITYERNSWGNKQGAGMVVQPSEINKDRAKPATGG